MTNPSTSMNQAEGWAARRDGTQKLSVELAHAQRVPETLALLTMVRFGTPVRQARSSPLRWGSRSTHRPALMRKWKFPGPTVASSVRRTRAGLSLGPWT
jgi:hypothetical protein